MNQLSRKGDDSLGPLVVLVAADLPLEQVLLLGQAQTHLKAAMKIALINTACLLIGTVVHVSQGMTDIERKYAQWMATRTAGKPPGKPPGPRPPAWHPAAPKIVPATSWNYTIPNLSIDLSPCDLYSIDPHFLEYLRHLNISTQELEDLSQSYHHWLHLLPATMMELSPFSSYLDSRELSFLRHLLEEVLTTSFYYNLLLFLVCISAMIILLSVTYCVCYPCCGSPKKSRRTLPDVPEAADGNVYEEVMGRINQVERNNQAQTQAIQEQLAQIMRFLGSGAKAVTHKTTQKAKSATSGLFKKFKKSQKPSPSASYNRQAESIEMKGINLSDTEDRMRDQEIYTAQQLHAVQPDTAYVSHDTFAKINTRNKKSPSHNSAGQPKVLATFQTQQLCDSSTGGRSKNHVTTPVTQGGVPSTNQGGVPLAPPPPSASGPYLAITNETGEIQPASQPVGTGDPAYDNVSPPAAADPAEAYLQYLQAQNQSALADKIRQMTAEAHNRNNN